MFSDYVLPSSHVWLLNLNFFPQNASGSLLNGTIELLHLELRFSGFGDHRFVHRPDAAIGQEQHLFPQGTNSLCRPRAETAKGRSCGACDGPGVGRRRVVRQQNLDTLFEMSPGVSAV